MKIKLTLLFCLIGSLSFSQTVVSSAKDFNWRVTPGYPNVNLRLFPSYQLAESEASMSGDYSKSIVYLSGNQAALLTQVNDKQCKVVLLSSDLKVIWEKQFDGRALAIGKLKGQLLLIRMDKLKIFNWKDVKFEAVLLNNSNGEIIKRKGLDYPQTHGPELKFYFSSKENYFFYGIRETSLPFKIVFSGWDDKYDNTESFQLTQFDENLNTVKNFKLQGQFINHGFLSSELDADDNLIIFSHDNNKIISEKFSANSSYSQSEQISTSIPIKNKTEVYPYSAITNRQDAYLLHLKYTNAEKDEQSDLLKFSFADKKVFTSTDILNKDFKKELNSLAENAKCQYEKTKFENLTDLKVSGILSTNKGQHVLLRETISVKTEKAGVSEGESYMSSEEAVVEIYDNKLKLQKRFIIPKLFTIQYPIGLVSSIFQKGDNLYFVGSHMEKRKLFSALSIIDLNKLEMTYCDVVPKKDLDKDSITDGPGTVWFADGYVINHTNYIFKGLFKAEYNIQLQKLKY
jgi:hypothetical protein